MVSSILPKKDIQHFNPLDFFLLNFLRMWSISIQTTVSISLAPCKKYPSYKNSLFVKQHTHTPINQNIKKLIQILCGQLALKYHIHRPNKNKSHSIDFHSITINFKGEGDNLTIEAEKLKGKKISRMKLKCTRSWSKV